MFRNTILFMKIYGDMAEFINKWLDNTTSENILQKDNTLQNKKK